MEWVRNVMDDPEVLEAVEDGDANPVAVLQKSFSKLIREMESANGDIQGYMQRSGRCTRGS